MSALVGLISLMALHSMRLSILPLTILPLKRRSMLPVNAPIYAPVYTVIKILNC